MKNAENCLTKNHAAVVMVNLTEFASKHERVQQIFVCLSWAIF